MHRRILSLTLLGFLSIVIINWSCTKLDTTNLGSDLIPVVDNVNTFADTFLINAVQKEYGVDDTTIVFNSDDHVIGNIFSDVLFGRTSAEIYMQLKPPYYPYALGFKDSLVGLDSVVLCLAYKNYWGDSNIVQQFQVYEIADVTPFNFRDSVYKDHATDYQAPIGNLIGTKTVDIRRLHDSIYLDHHKDSVVDQIRIKLDPAFAARLFNSDSSLSQVGGNHAFVNDSIFRREFNGLGIKSVGGDALIYTSLTDAKTRLEIHYRIKVAGSKIDTTFTSFVLGVNRFAPNYSATGNYIKRDRSGTVSTNPSADEIYLQTQPGTYASLTIPQLTGYSNRIIHRAEIIVEQIPDNINDTIFSVPNYLYLDLKEPGTTVPPKYKPIYIDLNPNVPYDPDHITSTSYYPYGGPDFGYFGGFARKRFDLVTGRNIVYYNINISRYVQRLVTKQDTNYEMRLFPAFDFHYPQHDPAYSPYSNSAAYGRVKVGSGTNPNYRMRLRIIYSPIK